MNYYISDIHFGWTNKYEGRTLDHDLLIKKNWNNCITNGDTVYILGDIGKEGRNDDNERLCELISTLKGRKILISGNHDKLKDLRIKQLFFEIYDYKEVQDAFDGNNYTLILSHYPILFWNGQHKGWIHLYGHLHNTDEEKIFRESLQRLNQYFDGKTKKGYKDCPEAKAFNVGTMMPGMDYTPRTLKEILEFNNSIG